ncbi:MAG TPA: signal peptidase I [Polyangiaceae bacterium]|nr:signal peptidase I [Polyangiaceae bacterium]
MSSGFIRVLGFTVLTLGALVGVLRLTCLRWWQVPPDDAELAASISPTLGPGDWVILWRATSPGFGDLVMCPDPEDPEEVFIGRIAAEGGDQFKIDETGMITVNNSRMRSERACESAKFTIENPRTGDEIELRCDIELLGGVHHPRALPPPKTTIKPVAVTREVEPGSLFLISDNRLFPFDSRDFGPLPKASCKEAIKFRLVSRLGFSDVKSRLTVIP